MGWKVLVAVIVCIVAQTSVCNPFYISTTGTDNTNCGSVESPCASLNYTLYLASDGDTIYFQEGLYLNQSISTITLDNISIIGQGNVTFGWVSDGDFDSFITIYGINSTLQNLQFSGYYYGRGPTTLALFFIVLSSANENQNANINYNFNDISCVNGSRSLIFTTNNSTIDYFGKININNLSVSRSFLKTLLWSVLEVNVNGLTIDNSTSQFSAYLNVFITQQVIPVDMTINNLVIANYSTGDFLNYWGPYYQQNNTGGTDTVTLTQFDVSDFSGKIALHHGANLIATSGSINNILPHTGFQSLFSLQSPISFTLTHCTLSNVPVNDLYSISNVYYSPSPVIIIDSLSISYSRFSLNEDMAGLSMGSFTNIQFLSSGGDYILFSISSNSIAENVYFNNCTAASLFSQNGSNSTISNITIANTICESECMSFVTPSSTTHISVNNITFDNVQTTATVPMITIYNPLQYPFVFSNTSFSNCLGFQSAFSLRANIVIEDSFTYSNVTSQQNSITPLFNVMDSGILITITTPVPQLSFSDFFLSTEVESNVTVSYMGFNFLASPTLPSFVANSNFPWAWVVLCACICLLAASLAVSFILYRRTSSYSTIN